VLLRIESENITSCPARTPVPIGLQYSMRYSLLFSLLESDELIDSYIAQTKSVQLLLHCKWLQNM